MRAALFLLALIPVSGAVPGSVRAGDTRGQVTDLVVFGKVRNLNSESLDDFGLQARFTARLQVTRVVRGPLPASVLTIRYVAHDHIPEDRERRFHLRRSGDDSWMVCGDRRRPGFICS